jgi:Holliday junction resolvasome RuvABC endonuclease subunit
VILALDPSSTCVGYALVAGPRPDQLVDGGLLRPKPAKLPIIARVRQFAQDFRELLEEHRPAVVVMEVSLSRHGRANDRGGASALGVYGLAVEYLFHSLETSGTPIETLDATQWTERLRKAKRTERIRAIYGTRYPVERDPGGDLADAIGIGRWWLQHSTHSARPTRTRANKKKTTLDQRVGTRKDVTARAGDTDCCAQSADN